MRAVTSSTPSRVPPPRRSLARCGASAATRLVRSVPPLFAALVLALVAISARDAHAAAAPAAHTAPTTPGYSAKGADTCLTCHGGDATVAGIFRTKHARPGDASGPFGHGGLQCEACHGPGGAHVDAMGDTSKIIAFGPNSHSSVQQQNANCLGCHQANAAHDWASSAHAASNLACTSCHRLHSPKTRCKPRPARSRSVPAATKPNRPTSTSCRGIRCARARWRALPVTRRTARPRPHSW